MQRAQLLTLIILCGLSPCAAALQAQQLDNVERALSWLPSDTETVIAARGPFVVPAGFPKREPATSPATNNDVDLRFQLLPMALLDIKNDLLLSRLKGLPVVAAIEGSRHARSPQALGEQPYEGAAIVIFAPGLSTIPTRLSKRSKAAHSETKRFRAHTFSSSNKKWKKISGRC